MQPRGTDSSIRARGWPAAGMCLLQSDPEYLLFWIVKEFGDGQEAQPEPIIAKLREAEIVFAQAGTIIDASRRLAVAEKARYRWRKGFGGLKTDQVRRMRDLEKEKLRLRQAGLMVLAGPAGADSENPPHAPSSSAGKRH